jgi:hypothetical protein
VATLICSLCAQPPASRIVTTGVDESGFRTVEKVPDRCPNPACEYHDRRNIDGDWLIELPE